MALLLHQKASAWLQSLEAEPAADPSALASELERLVELYPEFEPGLDRLGSLHEERSDYSAALRCLGRAAAGNPHNADRWAKIAALHFHRLREPRPALKALRNALALDESHPAAAALLAEMERRSPAP